MRLFYYCSSCQKENSFTTKAKNRIELQKERGNFINERCKNCGTINKRRINRVHAKANKWIILVGGILGILITCIIILSLPLFITLFVVPTVFSVPYLAWRYQEKKASAFNKVMLSDG